MRLLPIILVISYVPVAGPVLATHHGGHPTETTCDPTLWKHVYAGQFQLPTHRLSIVDRCTTVTGTIMSADPEKDGDWHIRVKLDPEYETLLNTKNHSGQHGYLVVEPMCANPVTQSDTIEEQVCKGFSQAALFNESMKGKRVSITGAYVLDKEHGWMEIHPVTSIKVIE